MQIVLIFIYFSLSVWDYHTAKQYLLNSPPTVILKPGQIKPNQSTEKWANVFFVIWVNWLFKWTQILLIKVGTGPCIAVSHCHLFCLTPPSSLLLSPSFSPSVLQVARSLQPLPPPCSLLPFRPPRPPPTTHPLARLHQSGNARCPCWRKTPLTLTWSPTRMTHTCSGPSPPPRVRELSIDPSFYLSFIFFIQQYVIHHLCHCISSSCVHFLMWFSQCSVIHPAIICFNLMSHLFLLAILFLLLCIPLKSACVCRTVNQTKGTAAIIV